MESIDDSEFAVVYIARGIDPFPCGNKAQCTLQRGTSFLGRGCKVMKKYLVPGAGIEPALPLPEKGF